jgi:four helix bundle protein
MKKPEDKSDKKNIQQRTFSFACRIVKLYQFLASQKSGIEILGRQVLKSGTAIGTNLEEATAGQSRADFISKCSIALKKARETLYWLRSFITTRIVSQKKLDPLAQEANEITAILTTIVKKTRRQCVPGK